MVALAVLAIALAAVTRAVGQAIDTTAALRDRVIALGIAQDRLARHRMLRDWPDTTTVTGTTDQGARVWDWREEVATTPYPDFRRVEVTVTVAGSKEVLARLVGYVRRHE